MPDLMGLVRSGHQPMMLGWLRSRSTASTHWPMKDAVGGQLLPIEP